MRKRLADNILSALESCRTCGMVATEFCLTECGNSSLYRDLFESDCENLEVIGMTFEEETSAREFTKIRRRRHGE